MDVWVMAKAFKQCGYVLKKTNYSRLNSSSRSEI